MRNLWMVPGLLLSLSTAVPAQRDTLSIPSAETVYKQNSWLGGTNPVGLSFNRFRSFSVAGIKYSHQDGNLGNVRIPASTNIYAIYSESFQKVDNVSFYGKIGYTNFQNRQQNWNGMTGNYWQVLNLCDSIGGKQQSEQYQLSAGFSFPFYPQWLLGGKVDYHVQLTAKDTDPRNKNQWMKWQFTPGIAYQEKNLRFGTSLLYIRQKETVDYRNMGDHNTYPVLVSYPMGFFKTFSWGENVNWHYTGQEAGGALQLGISHGFFQLFQEVNGSVATQTVESNRIQNRKESESDGWKMVYQGKLQQIEPSRRHEWEWQLILGGAHIYDPLQHQEESGIWLPDGKSLRSTRSDRCIRLSYGYYRLRDALHPRFSILSGILYRKAATSLLFYPLEYRQPLHRFSINTTFIQNFLLPEACLDMSLSSRYETGGGSMMEEKQVAVGQNAPQIPLWQNKSRLQQEFEYETSARWGAGVSVAYTRQVPFRWFIRLSFDYEKMAENRNNSDYQKITTYIGLLF